MKSLRPVLLCLAPALAIWFAPAIQNGLLYDRTAILHGEWWRLWTGHWMHFSVSHLAWNALVLAGAGAWLERLQPGSLIRYGLIAAPLLSLAFLIGEPAMQAYGGLSGLATGIVVLLALVQQERNGAGRNWWRGLLALVALKLAVEVAHPAPLFTSFDNRAVQPSTLAHATGAVVALGFFLSRRISFPSVLGRRPAVAGNSSR